MNPTPNVQPLSHSRRKYIFIVLLVIFICALPLFMFYATGYRFDFSDDARSIISTGGLYISAGSTNARIFVNEESVDNIRVFRSASYIQNLNEGIHKLTVQQENLQTWTKDLPVFPHIVTEAQSFNMPQIPQVRLVAPYTTLSGEQVVFVATTSEIILPGASTTNEIFKATTTATSSYQANPEYEYVVSLFATTTATGTTLVERVVDEVEHAFRFDSSSSSLAIQNATSTKIVRNVMLYRKGEEVFARYLGDRRSLPYYYCVDHVSASTTVAQYGEHVYESISGILGSSSEENIVVQNDRTRVCRNEIRIDRKWQEIKDFDFFPESTDLVLLLLEDGLYVVEIDDRAWQNTQLLYPGEDLAMVLDGNRLYVHDGDQYFEVLTELES